jgi:hypothetical protein
LLIRELDQSPGSESARQSVYRLARDYPESITPTDGRFWRWLAGRGKWDSQEGDLLSCLVLDTHGAVIEDSLRRAQTLTRDADPARAYTLAWLLERAAKTSLAAPLYEDAHRRAVDRETRQGAASRLLPILLERGDWKVAEQVLPDARSQGTLAEWSGQLEDVALAAAKGGASVEAIRLWGCAANLNPADLSRLKELAAVGLRTQLVGFYTTMQAELPSSAIPPMALELLGVRPAK